MQQTSVILDIADQDPLPQSPFCPLLEEARIMEVPDFSLNFKRDVDKGNIMLQIFKDRVVGVSGPNASYINLENEVSFGFNLQQKKIWFKSTENGAKEQFLAEKESDLKNFIDHLRTKCPQVNFLKNYELLEEKGRGKNSCVYTARKKSDQTIYAVKIQKYSSGLKQEIQILKELHHPNLIFLHEYFIEYDNQAYIVMEYEDGGSLLDIIKSEQQLSQKEKVKFITDMLNALEYLRIKGIVHRDLKPQNILFSEKDGNYKIADFGFSIKAGQKLERIAGTPGYIAPELLKEKSTELEADIKSDMYSMGLIFYEMFTFKQYYEGNSSEQILKKNIQKTSLKKKQNTGFSINTMQYSLLQKMIRSEPQRRKNSCQILKSELFRKVNKIYGLDYLSSTSSPSKTSGQDQMDDGFVDSFWKMIRIRSWSN